MVDIADMTSDTSKKIPMRCEDFVPQTSNLLYMQCRGAQTLTTAELFGL